MGNLYRIATLLLALPALVLAGEAVDAKSGVRIKHSDDWERKADLEKGGQPIFLVKRASPGYTMFVTSVGKADNYDAKAWLENEKKSLKTQVSDLGEMTIDRDRTVAGANAIGYEITGKISDKPVRINTYMVKRGARVFVFQAVSFQGAESTTAPLDLLDGISFQQAEGGADGADGDDTGAADIEDKLANWKMKKPDGWRQVSPPPVTKDVMQRAVIVNEGTQLRVLRLRVNNADIFRRAPGEVAELLVEEVELFVGFYGAGSKSMIQQSMRVDESMGMGGVDKTASFEIRSRTMDEIADVRDAEKKKAKGIKGVQIPEYKPTVLRGRLALISPYIYVIEAVFRPETADDPKMIAAYNKVVDSFEFFDTGAKPPAMQFAGKTYDDTFAGTEGQKATKDSHIYIARGRKAYKLEVSAKLPPGFQMIKSGFGNAGSIAIVAQDSRNRSFRLMMFHFSSRVAGEQNKVLSDKGVQFESWKSNWESKARGSKVRKTKKFRLGSIKGEGYQNLEGEVSGWPSTFTGILSDKSGWRTIVEVETTGGFYEAHEKEVKALLKSIKLKPKK